MRRVKAFLDSVVGTRLRTVRVLSGVARGVRLELDLSREKAYWLGSYERPQQEFLRRNLRAGDMFYDVGAHIGFFSVCAATLGASVYAFEAVASNAARIRRNAEVSGLAIQVVNAPVWATRTQVALVPGDSDLEWHVEEGSDMTAETIDAFASSHPAPSLIKIDVEGADASVLAGAARVLREHRPTLLCELHGDAQKYAVEKLLAGYSIERLGPWSIGATPQ